MKISAFVIRVEAIIYLLLFNLNDFTFKSGPSDLITHYRNPVIVRLITLNATRKLYGTLHIWENPHNSFFKISDFSFYLHE